MTETVPKTQKGVSLLLVYDKRLLLILRDDNPDIFCPCRWATPGGGIEEGEHPMQAAYREMKEELGNELCASMILKFLGTSPKQNSYFTGIIDDPDQIVLSEGIHHEFFSLDEIRTLIIERGDRKFGIGGALRTRILRSEKDYEYLQQLLEKGELLPPSVFE